MFTKGFNGMIYIKIQLSKLKVKLAAYSKLRRLVIRIAVISGLAGLCLFGSQIGPLPLLVSGNRAVYANFPILLNQDDLKIHVIDVGQGDATLIQYKAAAILIDTGPPEAGHKLTQYLKALGIKKLDGLILTHPHDDHVGSGKMILEEFSVGHLFVSHNTKENVLLEEIIALAALQNIPISSPVKDTTVKVADLSFRCLHPLPKDYSNINNYSSVWSLQYKSVGFLFLADIESDESDDLAFVPTAFVRSGHHGSVTSTNQSLLAKLSPKLFAISCGLNNAFGHPSKDVLGLLAEFQIPFFRTDRGSTKVISSDGASLRWVH